MEWIPVLPTKSTVVFPGTGVPLRVTRAQSVAAVKAAEEQKGPVLLVSERSVEPKAGAPVRIEDLYRVGTLAQLDRIRESDKGYQITVLGLKRYRIDQIEEAEGFLRGKGSVEEDQIDLDTETRLSLLESLKEVSRKVLSLVPADTSQLVELVNGIEDLGFLTHLCASNLDATVERKQELLEMVSVKNRTLALLEEMNRLRELLQLQGEIQERLSDKLGKSQREAILREQMKTIQEELGEGGEADKTASYREKIEGAGMPDETRKLAIDELARLEAMGPASPESHVIRNYLDLLIALPWQKTSQGKIDLERAREILEEDHYGLDKIKKRITQHLASLRLKKNSTGGILLLVGPPGVGKTSLGQSIARALGRKFVRGSLGGVRDDSEIRGHRRTYVGAMPGRIIQGIKRAGEKDPVFILDEVDKLSQSYHGDPAGALLEVLDPEQNQTFLDHYLDVPFDLSQVFFIATANTIDTIPAALLDRMEVIPVSGYTTAEKFHIAKRHLVPKELSQYEWGEKAPEITDEALLRIIHRYTREAGVRELSRQIATIIRASTEKYIDTHSESGLQITPDHLEEILGPERFTYEAAERVAAPGVVTGLAWTPHGGDILFIEGGDMPGTGKLILTGQLGEVMKESAQIAFSLVRSRLAGILPEMDFNKRDIHIHVPAGAIPKDGPSAGITLLTSLASLFLKKSVSPQLAMTGEITLRGSVMPVGGIKEKLIAAHRAGIKHVLLPKKNEKDLKEIPQEVLDQIQVDWVDSVESVLEKSLRIDLSHALQVARLPSRGETRHLGR